LRPDRGRPEATALRARPHRQAPPHVAIDSGAQPVPASMHVEVGHSQVFRHAWVWLNVEGQVALQLEECAVEVPPGTRQQTVPEGQSPMLRHASSEYVVPATGLTVPH